MKNLLVLVLFAFSMSIHSQVVAQDCPTGLQECYLTGRLDGSHVYSMQMAARVDFSLFTSSYCPSGRLDCSRPGAYTITVTRHSGNGLVKRPGGTPTGAASVSYTYNFPICTGENPLELEFRSSATTSDFWTVALTYVEGGRICTYNIWEVSLETPEIHP